MGTVIVAAVVIIFLPDLLDGEKKSNQVEFEAIPKAKVFSGKLTNKPFPEDKVATQTTDALSTEKAKDEELKSFNKALSKGNETITIEVSTPPKVAKPTVNIPKLVMPEEKPRLPEKAIAKEAWVIHLGSFKDKENVTQLLAKLKAKGYVAFTKPIKTKQGVLTKVIIGPELIKPSLSKKLPALKALTGIQGKVAYFEANK